MIERDGQVTPRIVARDFLFHTEVPIGPAKISRIPDQGFTLEAPSKASDNTMYRRFDLNTLVIQHSLRTVPTERFFFRYCVIDTAPLLVIQAEEVKPVDQLGKGYPAGKLALTVYPGTLAPDDLPDSLLLSMSREINSHALTDREKEILISIANTLSFEQTAKELGNPVATIRTHQKNIHSKMGISELRQAVVWAIRGGVIPLNEVKPIPAKINFQDLTLTPTELKVLQCFADGLSAEETMAFLSFKSNTLYTHHKNIYRKMGVSDYGQLNSLAATIVAIQNRLVNFAIDDQVR